MTDLSIALGRDASQPIVPATARGEATRRKLLEAAERDFGEKGFHAASVSSITHRAGVGQGTFYLYFRSKEEIFAMLVKDIGHELRRRMAVAVTAATSLEQAVHGGISAFLGFSQQHPGLFRIVQESQFVDEPTYREYYHHLEEGYRAGLMEAQRRGYISAGDAEVRAWAIIGITHFLGLRYCLWQGRLPEAEVMGEVTRFVTRAMNLRPEDTF
ncbi:TetR/AcrR family transcriptional regulator [Solimonas sp. K1W22B-7]|uniref:TetR/AcrR family transcriptional regulator n=1 Tax=Solimonas sp. K1W22B-7 TaxID=2303331 RepID=UPI000E3337DF|nr:TetR/AcrR family transcriptional regulator [Solimonas sp. K1W22B-7]AXQ31230.1 TetR/AcrR family transcriptional regulator [Solimonas sp. K1W22B-7]